MPARSCRRSPPGSSPSLPMAWSTTCSTERRDARLDVLFGKPLSAFPGHALRTNRRHLDRSRVAQNLERHRCAGAADANVDTGLAQAQVLQRDMLDERW